MSAFLYASTDVYLLSPLLLLLLLLLLLV